MPCGCQQQQSNGQPTQWAYYDEQGKTVATGTEVQVRAAFIRAGKTGTVRPL